MVEIYIMEFKLDNIKNWGLKFQRCKDKLVLKNKNMLEYAVIIYPSIFEWINIRIPFRKIHAIES